jgi:zinc transport system substrate-binding protein
MFKTILFSFLFLTGILTANETIAAKPTVLVTLAPYKFFVERIAGDTVKIALLVPPAASSHTFEPTPKQTLEAGRAALWFIMGEPFETRALPAIKNNNPAMQVIDLRQGVQLIYGHHCHAAECHHGVDSADLHLWLSPKIAQIQARTIAKGLIQLLPQHSDLYTKNLETLLQELQALDQEINNALAPLQNRFIMVSHPAYAYFCREYTLTQLSIEFEGRDPTPQQLTSVLNEARTHGIKTIFTQPQYSNKGAKLIASYLNAQVVSLDPYSEDYFNSMRSIALHFAEK